MEKIDEASGGGYVHVTSSTGKLVAEEDLRAGKEENTELEGRGKVPK